MKTINVVLGTELAITSRINHSLGSGPVLYSVMHTQHDSKSSLEYMLNYLPDKIKITGRLEGINGF